MANDQWTTVEVNDLRDTTAGLYHTAKEAYRAYKAARDVFETKMQGDFADHIPIGSELKFGYNFGKLSIAVGPARERKAAKAKQGLADWLAGQAQVGHSA